MNLQYIVQSKGTPFLYYNSTYMTLENVLIKATTG